MGPGCDQAAYFSDSWEALLVERTKREGRVHRGRAAITLSSLVSALSIYPKFAIGRAGWDNWMIYHARWRIGQ
jgi:hypothetical protein